MNATTLRDQLLRLPAPSAVTDYRVQVGVDSTADPAVWVFVVVDNVKADELWPQWDQLRERIRTHVVAEAGETNVYIRLWAAADLDQERQATA